MILTDFYLLQELRVMKSHRFDCVAHNSLGYPPFEAIAQRSKGKVFFCYCSGLPDTFSADAKRKADIALTNGHNISSVFVPDVMNYPLLGHGDTYGTNDALLFRFSPDYKQIEIFVARGYKNNARQLYQLFIDGELDEEINTLINSVVTDLVTV